MNVLVTGASGSVGYQVTKKLIENDHTVLAFDLPEHRRKLESLGSNVLFYPYNFNLPVNYIQPGLSNFKYSVNVHGIINTAAILDLSKSYDNVKNLNTMLPYHLRKSYPGIPMVHISTGSIYRNNGSLITENKPIKINGQCNSAYELSKSNAEQILFDHFSNTNTTILRPSLIYGPGAGYLGAALAAIPPMVKSISNSTIGFKGGPRTNWVHCEDVARASIWALERYTKKDDMKYIFDIFNVCDDIAHPFGDTITEYMKQYGLNIKRTIQLPTPQTLKKCKFFLDNKYLPKLCNTPAQFYWNAIKHYYKLDGKLHVSIDKGMIDYLFQDTIFSNHKIKEAGFNFKHPNSKPEIASTLQWYIKNKWIPA